MDVKFKTLAFTYIYVLTTCACTYCEYNICMHVYILRGADWDISITHIVWSIIVNQINAVSITLHALLSYCLYLWILIFMDVCVWMCNVKSNSVSPPPHWSQSWARQRKACRRPWRVYVYACVYMCTCMHVHSYVSVYMQASVCVCVCAGEGHEDREGWTHWVHCV